MDTRVYNSPLRLGIIGTGRIAGRFAIEAKAVETIAINYVYNPNLSSAEEFAKKHCIKFAYVPAELYNSVDAVYIASPHGTHYDYIKAAILNKKHVLCEKPMVLKKAQAEELFALAKQNNCVLFEAVKTAYAPGFAKVLEQAASGKIGEIKDVEACFTKLADTALRELADAKYGGSFTELASYTLLAIIKLLGTSFEDIRFESIKAANGVDIYTKAYFKANGCFASSKTGLGVKSEGQLIISGTNGYIRVNAPWWKTSSFEICYEDLSKNEQHQIEFKGDGLRYEINDFAAAIKSGRPCAKLTAEESIAMADIIERFLADR